LSPQHTAISTPPSNSSTICPRLISASPFLQAYSAFGPALLIVIPFWRKVEAMPSTTLKIYSGALGNVAKVSWPLAWLSSCKIRIA
jgi:hypothetical protein